MSKTDGSAECQLNPPCFFTEKDYLKAKPQSAAVILSLPLSPEPK
jgi:hypothetical protein